MRWLRSTLTTVSIGSLAAAVPASDVPKPLFANTEPVHLTIRAPLGMLANSQGKTQKPLGGILTVDGANPDVLAIAVSTRGITRGDRSICPFPPLRIDFPQTPSETSLFVGQRSLKLVTHCRRDASFEHYMLLEYAAYRMYALLTQRSFDVRLASIDYIDKDGKKLASRKGFFIEDVKDMAHRNGVKRVKTANRVAVTALSAHDAAVFAVFEYMIGNLDWAMTAGPAGTNCCHNSRLIAPPRAVSGLVPVPYDFDFAGIVDAPYATPPEGIPLPNVRVRRYRGYCRHDAEARQVAADMLAQRAALIGVLDAVPDLDVATGTRLPAISTVSSIRFPRRKASIRCSKPASARRIAPTNRMFRSPRS